MRINYYLCIDLFIACNPLPAQTTCKPDAVQTWLEANAFGYLEVAEVTATPQEQPQGKDKKRVKKTVRQEAPSTGVVLESGQPALRDLALRLALLAEKIDTSANMIEEKGVPNKRLIMITDNDAFCRTGLFESFQRQMEKGEMVYWLHLWKAPPGQKDRLYAAYKSEITGERLEGQIAAEAWKVIRSFVRQSVFEQNYSGIIYDRSQMMLYIMLDKLQMYGAGLMFIEDL